jgi:hypothetical protein
MGVALHAEGLRAHRMLVRISQIPCTCRDGKWRIGWSIHWQHYVNLITSYAYLSNLSSDRAVPPLELPTWHSPLSTWYWKAMHGSSNVHAVPHSKRECNSKTNWRVDNKFDGHTSREKTCVFLFLPLVILFLRALINTANMGHSMNKNSRSISLHIVQLC